MPTRDYLIRQFEEMGFFLASLIRRLLKMKDDNQQEQMETAFREALIQELKLDIDQVIVLANQDFLSHVKQYFTSAEQLEKLADILKILGQEKGPAFSLAKANYLQKSLFLYTTLQETSDTYSYARREKMLELQELIRFSGLM